MRRAGARRGRADAPRTPEMCSGSVTGVEGRSAGRAYQAVQGSLQVLTEALKFLVIFHMHLVFILTPCWAAALQFYLLFIPGQNKQDTLYSCVFMLLSERHCLLPPGQEALAGSGNCKQSQDLNPALLARCAGTSTTVPNAHFICDNES